MLCSERPTRAAAAARQSASSAGSCVAVGIGGAVDLLRIVRVSGRFLTPAVEEGFLVVARLVIGVFFTADIFLAASFGACAAGGVTFSLPLSRLRAVRPGAEVLGREAPMEAPTPSSEDEPILSIF